MSLFGKYMKVKVKDVKAGANRTLVTWDPEGASEADILEKDEQLNLLVAEAIDAKNAADSARDAADTIVSLSNNLIAGVEVLLKRRGTLTDLAQVTEIDAVVAEELEKLKQMQPEIDRLEAAAQLAEKDKKELDDLCEVSANKLKTARKQLTEAKTGMDRAAREVKQAKERAERQAVVAGITQDTDDTNTALGVMNANAAKLKAEAEAFNKKADLLQPAKKSTLMEEAMKEAAGPAPVLSAEDQLAAIKAKRVNK